MVIGQGSHLISTWLHLIGQENISFTHLHKSPSLLFNYFFFTNSKSYINQTLYIFIHFFISSRIPTLAKSLPSLKQTLGLLAISRTATWILGSSATSPRIKFSISAFPELVEIPNRSFDVSIFTHQDPIIRLYF